MYHHPDPRHLSLIEHALYTRFRASVAGPDVDFGDSMHPDTYSVEYREMVTALVEAGLQAVRGAHFGVDVIETPSSAYAAFDRMFEVALEGVDACWWRMRHTAEAAFDRGELVWPMGGLFRLRPNSGYLVRTTRDSALAPRIEELYTAAITVGDEDLVLACSIARERPAGPGPLALYEICHAGVLEQLDVARELEAERCRDFEAREAEVLAAHFVGAVA